MSARRLMLVALAVSALAVVFVLRQDRGDRPNIVVLLLDCVRADHLGCYGYGRETSPAIDSIAGRGLRCELAVSPSSWTLPSVSSLLTGADPAIHGAGTPMNEERFFDLRADSTVQGPLETLPLLTEVLSEHGYETSFFSSNSFVGERFFGRGSATFQLVNKAPAREVVQFGIENARRAVERGQPFFLYLHFMDAHIPLEPPEPYMNAFQFEGRANTEHLANWLFTNPEERQHELFEIYRQQKICVYDGSILYIDSAVERLETALAALGVLDDTIVVIVGDHGEAFWEHAETEATLYDDPRGVSGVGHGHSLFQEVLHVPLILAGPGLPEGEVVAGPVGLVDVFPTLLELVGIEIPAHLSGRALTRPGGPRTRSVIVSESSAYGAARVAVLDYPLKYIHSHGEQDLLFDLSQDPGETTNLLMGRPAEEDALRKQAERRLEMLDRHSNRDGQPLDTETIQDLIELGYLGDG